MPAGHSQRNPSDTTQLDHQSSPTNGKNIRNKDGTKLITVPSRKVSNPDSISAASSPPAPAPAPMDYSNGANSNSIAGKKKNKKNKKAGKQVPQSTQQQHRRTPSGDEDCDYNRSNGPGAPPPPNHPHHYQQDIRNSMADFDQHDPPELVDADEEEEYYSDQDGEYDDNGQYSPPPSSAPAPAAGKSKKNKKKKNKKAGGGGEHAGGGGAGQGQGRKSKDRIWNTSTSEERERIKDFWLSLGEDERRSLVKVEKEAVLRKMKEQQKHSCSCSVCGRKRTAIEEELEVLYDAYYEELEQYANQQQNKFLSHVPPSPPPGAFSSSSIPPPPPPPGPPPRISQGNQARKDHDTKAEEVDEDLYEDDDEEYVLEDEDDSLEHPMSPPPQNDPRPDFFNFGNSLTVQGGILTVADDLLKNDGKKFIEMMEQLAERRMAREEEASHANGTLQRDASLHQHQHHVHNHTQPSDYDDEDDDYEEDEDEDYEDDEEEEEEPDTMTEEQRMEEGRRMFQIFAARMFEQRVLQAYREKVAAERQNKLLQELDDEKRRKEEREAKKAQDKDKKREKKRQAKQAKEEERLKKEAEKREEEERLKAIEAKKAEEQRKRREELRLKRDAEKKAADEEKRRKEEEKRKRQEEEREREAEKERKRKENQERERKKQQEAAKKAKEEKETRDRELREKREREDREKREREAKAKKEAAEKERKRKEEETKAKADAAAAAKRAQQAFVSTPIIPHPQPAPPLGYGASPHLPVVTPATPKQSASTQLQKPRTSSQQGSIQGSQGSSPKTPSVGPRLGSSASPSTPVLQQTLPGPIPVKGGFAFPGFPPTSPMPHHIGPPPGVIPPEGIFTPMSPIGMNGPNPMQPFLPNMSQRQSISNGMPIFGAGQMPLHSPQYRGFAASNGLTMQLPPPGMRPMGGQGRGLFMGDMTHQPPPGVPFPPPGSPFSTRMEPVPMSGHSRIPSGGFDQIHRPAPMPTPIQRPSSVAPQRNGDDQVDELSNVMGSRALLEDDDEPLTENMSPSRRVSAGPHFAPRPIRGVSSAGIFGDGLGFNDYGASWSNTLPLGGSSLPSAWANKAGWSDIDAGAFNRRRTTRIDQIRILACQQFQELSGPSRQPVEISTLQRAVLAVASPDLRFAIDELTHTLDVEGDSQNGGGSFEQRHENGRVLVYYSPDEFADLHHNHGPIRAGEIGSPSTTGAVPFKTPLGAPPGMASSPAGF